MTTPDLSTPRGDGDEYFWMDVLSAITNARFALEYWMREAAVNARDERWAEHGRKRSRLECEALQWIEGHLRAKLEARRWIDPENRAPKMMARIRGALDRCPQSKEPLP